MSRLIVVNDVKYRWIASGNDNGINVYIQSETGKGQKLHFVCDYSYTITGDTFVQNNAVTSAHVRKAIEMGITNGWTPNINKKMFFLPFQ